MLLAKLSSRNCDFYKKKNNHKFMIKKIDNMTKMKNWDYVVPQNFWY